MLYGIEVEGDYVALTTAVFNHYADRREAPSS
jgi:hypothetical protein